jgi:hypothetical protein
MMEHRDGGGGIDGGDVADQRVHRVYVGDAIVFQAPSTGATRVRETASALEPAAGKEWSLLRVGGVNE